MIRVPYVAAILSCLATAIAAQTPPEAARNYTTAHRTELVQQFSELLSIPNVAADPANLKRNADALLE
ncbi:MAG: peptidase M20, partial [Candidatus Sulfotelmatobacter sp.]